MKRHPFLTIISAIAIFFGGYYVGISTSSHHDSVNHSTLSWSLTATPTVYKPLSDLPVVNAASIATSVPKKTATPKPTSNPKKQKYVLNIRSKKFHYPDCRSVKKMDNSNKMEVTWSRTEIINKCYSPCGNCNP